MGVEKVSISLPRELAAQIDEVAQADGVTRSQLIAEAAASYITRRRRVAEEDARRESIDRALIGLDELASRWGDDELPGVVYLHEVRGDVELPTGPEGTDDA